MNITVLLLDLVKESMLQKEPQRKGVRYDTKAQICVNSSSSGSAMTPSSFHISRNWGKVRTRV